MKHIYIHVNKRMTVCICLTNYLAAPGRMNRVTAKVVHSCQIVSSDFHVKVNVVLLGSKTRDLSVRCLPDVGKVLHNHLGWA